jgi:uncharacterized membrane protein
MKTMRAFIKTTIAGGFLFLVPLGLTVLLVREVLQFARKLFAPIARLLPAEHVAGIAVVDLLTVVVIVAVCFVAGLFAQTRMGRAFGDRLERAVLGRIPGFTFLKSITRDMVGLGTGTEVAAALARIEEAWVPSFVMEQHASGLFTVFVPSAPAPTAGSIYYLTADRVKLLDVPTSAVVACIMRLGVGSRELLERAALGQVHAGEDVAGGGTAPG